MAGFLNHRVSDLKLTLGLNWTIINLVKKIIEEVRKMARKITDKCVACGTCQASCPVNCISEGDIYKIDPQQCIDCGTCESACPVGAIIQE